MAATGTPMPYVKIQFFTDSGLIASGYQLFSYQPGTTTKQDTYTDVDLSVANTNPIVLDSAGRAVIYLSPLSYKFVLALPTAADPPAPADIIWTADNTPASPELNTAADITGTAGENLVLGNWIYLSQGDAGRTAGRWYKTDADLTYGSSAAGALGYVLTTSASTGEAIQIRKMGRVTGLSGLIAGEDQYLSATAGAITSSAPSSNRRIIGVADSTTSMIFSPDAITRAGTSSHEGVLNREAQDFLGEKTFAVQPLAYAGGVDLGYMSLALDVQYGVKGTSGAGETVLFTYTLPGGTLAAHNTGSNLPGLRVSWSCYFAADADVKLMKLHFGATALTVTNLAVNLASNEGRYTAIIRRIDATHQVVSASGVVSTATAAAGAGYHFAARANPGETLANNIVVKLTGQNSTDADNNAIVAYDWMIEMVG